MIKGLLPGDQSPIQHPILKHNVKGYVCTDTVLCIRTVLYCTVLVTITTRLLCVETVASEISAMQDRCT